PRACRPLLLRCTRASRFGEPPEVCAAGETLEETGITVSNVEFVAITNDVLADAGKRYWTVWMRGDLPDGRCWPRAPANLPWGELRIKRFGMKCSTSG